MERLAGRVMLGSSIGRAITAIAAGAFGALALPPFGFFASLFVSFTLLVWLVDGCIGKPGSGAFGRLWPAFRIGWCFGFGYFVAGLWWLGNALLLEADEFAWALPLAILGLPAVLALFYGFAVALANILWSDGLGRIAALAGAFGLSEWLRSFVATGFPWNVIGYGIMPIPVMMQSAHLIGLFGVTILAVFIFAMPALVGTKKGMWPGLALAALLLAGHFGYGFYRLRIPVEAPSDALTVRIVQPSIDQSRKMLNADRADIFNEHLRLTALPPSEGKRRPDIVVWPETSVPFILTQNPDALAEIARTLEDGQVLFTGAVRMEDAGAGRPPRYYNSVYAIDSQGEIIGASDKVHLTPFGEYLPLEDVLRRFGFDNVVSLPGGFSAAASRNVLTLPSGKTFYPLICYEIIFPGEMTPSPAGATAILNVTNDGWFGDTPGPYQHFLQARVRAVETGLPVIRGANTGISAVIDPYGRIIDGLDYGQIGIVDSTLSGVVGDAFTYDIHRTYFWLIFLVMMIAAVVSRLSFMRRMN